jgi:hypothetical protein
MGRARGFVGRLSAVVLAVALVGLATPADANEASHWSSERTGPRPTEPPSSISCPSRHSCTLITAYGTELSYDGDTWGTPRSPDHDLGAVSSVSCPSRSFCAAAGGYVVVVEKGGHWGRVRPVGAWLTDVSCPSSRWCLAVGWLGYTVRYRGGSWHQGPRAPQRLESVSCTSRTFCMAEGGRGQAYRFDGRRWHRAGDIGTSGDGPNGLSCGSRDLCLATGGGRDAARWNGHRWIVHEFGWGEFEHGAASCAPHFCELLTNAHAVEWHAGWGAVSDVPSDEDTTVAPPLSCSARGRCVAVTVPDGAIVPSPPSTTLSLRNGIWRTSAFPDSTDVVRGLSCPTASFCMGTHDDATTSRMLRGGTWTTIPMPTGWHGAFGVDCTSPMFCLAVDLDGGAAVWDGSTWSSADPLDSDGSFDCASPTFCVAVTTTGTRVWNGVAWSSSSTTPLDVQSVSCPAQVDCWAGGEESDVAHFDGTSWSTAQMIAPTGTDGFNTMRVSCGSPTSCGAADQLGDVFTYTGGTWGHRKRVGGRNDIVAFDCGSSTSCTAVLGRVEDDGKVSRWNGTSWTTSRALPRGYSDQATSLSCATRKHCVLVTRTGIAWVRS